jgi:polysaccharide chain length determinant protein (PEP-CTERM system associated)
VLPGKTYAVDDILRIAWDRKWLISLPAVVIATAVVMYARTLPDQYRSETTILIVPQRVPESYVRATVTSRIEDRLPSLRQQILSRDRLERTIVDFDLYPEERATVPMEALVGRMRDAINVNLARGDAFSVSYVSTDPRAAMLVAERLASQFIEENVREREVLAEGTNQFLETQLVEARGRLEDHEQKLAEYRRRYSGELPSQLDSNLQILNSLNVQAQNLSNDIERDRDRRLVLERSVLELREPDAAAPGPARPSVVPAAPTSIEERLESARASLADLRTRLTSEHPDISVARRLVADLERQAAAERSGVRTVASTEGTPPPVSAASSARDRRLHDLLLERENLDRQIARKQQEEARIRAEVTTYQARVEATPARESELIALTRDYETLQNIYTNLLSKREDSAVAANLEKRQVGEQFKVLDPARVPQTPFSPNRVQLNLMGLIAGLGFGLGLAGLLEFRDSTLKSEDDIRRCLSLPVLAAIPVLGGRASAEPPHKSAALGAFRLTRWLIRGDARES